MSSPYCVLQSTTLALLLVASVAQAQEEGSAPEAAPVEAWPARESQWQAHPPPREAPLVTVTLTDGQQLRGLLVYEDARELELELVSGSRMRLPRQTVRDVKEDPRLKVTEDARLMREDPNRTRYLYAPSAHMLRKGEGYFSAKELFFYSVGYGVTDNFSVLAGTVPYTWLFAGTNGFNLVAAAKVGGELTEGVHVAGGAEVFLLPAAGGGFGLGFGALTLGNTDTHLTVSAGVPFAFYQSYQSMVGNMLITIDGTLRVSPGVALVSENWILPGFMSRDANLINALAVRLISERWAVDLGFIGVKPMGTSYLPVPIPWLDFTYNFG